MEGSKQIIFTGIKTVFFYYIKIKVSNFNFLKNEIKFIFKSKPKHTNFNIYVDIKGNYQLYILYSFYYI